MLNFLQMNYLGDGKILPISMLKPPDTPSEGPPVCECSARERSRISFNISGPRVDELTIIVFPSGARTGILSEPPLLVGSGTSTSFSRTEQGAPGRQNGL